MEVNRIAEEAAARKAILALYTFNDELIVAQAETLLLIFPLSTPKTLIEGVYTP